MINNSYIWLRKLFLVKTFLLFGLQNMKLNIPNKPNNLTPGIIIKVIVDCLIKYSNLKQRKFGDFLNFFFTIQLLNIN